MKSDSATAVSELSENLGAGVIEKDLTKVAGVITGQIELRNKSNASAVIVERQRRMQEAGDIICTRGVSDLCQRGRDRVVKEEFIVGARIFAGEVAIGYECDPTSVATNPGWLHCLDRGCGCEHCERA